MLTIRDLILPLRHDPSMLYYLASQALGIRASEIAELRIRRRSLDARKKPELRFNYTVDVSTRTSEKQILHVVRTLSLPVVKSPCPANGYTVREEMKQLLNDICKKIPNARELLLSALQNTEQYGLWEKQQP